MSALDSLRASTKVRPIISSKWIAKPGAISNSIIFSCRMGHSRSQPITANRGNRQCFGFVLCPQIAFHRSLAERLRWWSTGHEWPSVNCRWLLSSFILTQGTGKTKADVSRRAGVIGQHMKRLDFTQNTVKFQLCMKGSTCCSVRPRKWLSDFLARTVQRSAIGIQSSPYSFLPHICFATQSRSSPPAVLSVEFRG
jgi:hypothetical protein